MSVNNVIECLDNMWIDAAELWKDENALKFEGKYIIQCRNKLKELDNRISSLEAESERVIREAQQIRM